jgi:hypothetical protein
VRPVGLGDPSPPAGALYAFGTEFFIAYPSESPFRELLALGLLMTVVVAVLPDTLDREASPVP